MVTVIPPHKQISRILLRSTKENAYYLGLDAMRFQGLGAIFVGLDQITEKITGSGLERTLPIRDYC